MMYLRSFSENVLLSVCRVFAKHSGILTPSCSSVSSLVHCLLFGVSDLARHKKKYISSRQTLPEVCSEQDELDFLMEALIIR